MPRTLLTLLPLAFLFIGCAADPTNPSFPVTTDAAQAALKVMKEEPKALARPVVVIGGYLSPGLLGNAVREGVESATSDERIVYVSLFTCGDFDDCRDRVLAAVDRAFPNDHPSETTEVDVVGISMGGLAARYAAAPAPQGASKGRRLRIARLFTLGTPHQGASLAELPTFIKLQAQMRKGSKFLTELEAATADADYPIIPYVRLHDNFVGERNAAPPGQVPFWLPNKPFENAHLFLSFDARIIADIARRLRDEEPFAKGPPAPLPG